MMAAQSTRTTWPWIAIAIIAGAAISAALLLTASQTEPEKRTRSSRIVQVISVESHTANISVTAYGTVIPSRTVEIQTQVGGRIIARHPSLVPGGRIPADAQIIMLDPSDYQIAVEEKRADLAEAEFALAVEQGRQVVAAREWKLLEKELDASEVNRSLVLREPHLKRADAAIKKADHAISKALLDLSRTVLPAPFNCVVLTESAEVGQLVEAGKTIATLAGTDVFWVQATVPVGDLAWIKFPDPDKDTKGAMASITLDAGDSGANRWQGHVERLLGDLEPSGRMARVLIAVKNPLTLSAEPGALPLLLGSYVRVEIDAGELENVIAIPRAALRGDDRLWGVDAENKLQIHDTETRWVNGDTLLVANTLGPGEKLVVSGLRAALPGMEVDPQPAPDSVSAER